MMQPISPIHNRYLSPPIFIIITGFILLVEFNYVCINIGITPKLYLELCKYRIEALFFYRLLDWWIISWFCFALILFKLTTPETSTSRLDYYQSRYLPDLTTTSQDLYHIIYWKIELDYIPQGICLWCHEQTRCRLKRPGHPSTNYSKGPGVMSKVY